MQILTTAQTKSLWLLFNRVAQLTPGNVAIGLLDRYKFDLTRFAADTLNQLAQNIVIGSQYPDMCVLYLCSQVYINNYQNKSLCRLEDGKMVYGYW